jgi:hypothetical protein
MFLFCSLLPHGYGRPFDLPYMVEQWDDTDSQVEELIALTGDYGVARAAYEEAVKRRPGRIVTLRQKKSETTTRALAAAGPARRGGTKCRRRARAALSGIKASKLVGDIQGVLVFGCSNPAHQQQHQQYDDQNAKNTGWSVSPPSAVTPIGKGSNKNEDKDYEQYGSDRHFGSPSVGIICGP